MKHLAVLAVCLTATTAAHAEPRAWTAAKKTLPGGLQAVVGVNVAPIKASQLYQQLLPMAMAKAGDAQSKLDKFKATCGIEATGILDSVVMGMTSDEKAVIVIALKGTDQKGLEACGQKIAAGDGKKLTITKDGGFVKYSGMGDDDAYVKWLAKDTLAIAEDKDTLTKLTAGGLAKDAMTTQAKKVNTDAALWAVVKKEEDIPDFKAKMTSAYGSLDLKGGNMSADVHVVLDSAKSATDSAAQAQAQLDGVKKSGQVPKQFAAALDSVTIKAAGPELVIGAKMAEADVASMLGMLAAFAH
jgi:hypothetical protein